MLGMLLLTVAREQALMKSILVSVMLIPTANSKLLELVKVVTKEYSEDTTELSQKERRTGHLRTSLCGTASSRLWNRQFRV